MYLRGKFIPACEMIECMVNGNRGLQAFHYSYIGICPCMLMKLTFSVQAMGNSHDHNVVDLWS